MRPYYVRDLMSQPAIVISWDETILAASGLMQSRDIRRLPVVDDEGIVAGILSLGDVREAMSVYNTASPYAPDSDEILLDVDEVMTAPAITVGPDDTLLHVIHLFVDHKIGGIPVVDDAGRPLGMVTESDIFRLLIQLWEKDD